MESGDEYSAQNLTENTVFTLDTGTNSITGTGTIDYGNYIPLPAQQNNDEVLTYSNGNWESRRPQPRGIKIYNKPGTYSWTAPQGVFSVEVAIYSAGGGGGNTTGWRTAGGGGSGAFAIYCVGVTPKVTYSLTVGAGGSPTAYGSASGGIGNSGGNSISNIGGTSVTLTGGTGGGPNSVGVGGTVPTIAAIEFVNTNEAYFTGLEGAGSGQEASNSFGGRPGTKLKDGQLSLVGGIGWLIWTNTQMAKGGNGRSTEKGVATSGQDGAIILRW